MNIPKVACSCGCNKWDLDEVSAKHICIGCEGAISTSEMLDRITDLITSEEREVA